MSELAGRAAAGRSQLSGRLLVGGRLVPGTLQVAGGKIESLALMDVYGRVARLLLDA